MTVPHDIYAVLVAIADDTLLLPNLAVAEVLGSETRRAVDGPAWLAGEIDWSGRRLPVVRIEILNGHLGTGVPPRRQRVLVVHATDHRLTTGLYGIAVEGYPHLVTLNRNAVKPAHLRANDRAEIVAARVNIANQETLIPNLERIEAELIALLPSELRAI